MTGSKQKKPGRFMWTAFAAAAGVATVVYLFNDVSHEPVRALTPQEQDKVKSDPVRNPPPKNGEDTFLKADVPGAVSDDQTKTVPPQAPSQQYLDDKQIHLDTARDYYQAFLTESDPIERYKKLSNVNLYKNLEPDVLKMLGMTKERFEGLVKSVDAQAGPPILEKIREMKKYDDEKIRYVVDLKDIGESLTNGNRIHYYQSLGTTRSELQGHLCDGAVAEARGFLSRAMNAKADKMTQKSYKNGYISYLELIAELMPSHYKIICDDVGRDAYVEINITDDRIKELLEFKPEIIPEPKPGP